MKIFHLADTHIGYSAYSKLDADGYNQREMDVYSAFDQVVETALAESPDLVLHCGDLFDTVRPSNRAISFVMGELLKLSDAGIPTVIISGNHSTPRLRETGSVFRVFEHVKGLHLAYTGKCERFSFDNLMVHALPHSADKELFETELDSLRPDPDFTDNIAMLHSGVAGLDAFRMSEFNELIAKGNQLDRGFEYVALGHFHQHIRATESAVYSGSTERMGFGEVGQPKGFIELDSGSGKWKFRELKIRPMLDLPWVDCAGLRSDDVFRTVLGNIEKADIGDAIVRQKLTSIDRKEFGHLDTAAIRKAASEALHFELRPAIIDSGQSVASQEAAFDSLEREFSAYIGKADMGRMDPEELEKLGLEYLKPEESE